MSLLQDLIPSIRFERWAPTALRKHLWSDETESIEALCQLMMDSDGEYSSLLLAERILTAYEKLDTEARLQFFTLLHSDYDIDVEQLKIATDSYQTNSNANNLLAVTRAAEPRRQELLRRINLAPGGTRRLVKMREHLLESIRETPELKKIDTDFHHLLRAWFNRSFLLMEPIDWTTPAHILEKIIAYEAVHEIENWEALRNRLQPADRYCYAFFHPSMEDEPLVFVEVALTETIPQGIGEVLQQDRTPETLENTQCAIFYSISTCHRGLSGVSFGNFLIKQVATSLKLRFPHLKTFATISPVPGFGRWLRTEAKQQPEIAALIDAFNKKASAPLRHQLQSFVASYFLEQKNEQLEPLDPVARFHLKNGATLERINILANPSDTGMASSFGTMVNYVYDLSRVEENHEDYVKNHQIVASAQVKKSLAKKSHPKSIRRRPTPK